METSLSTSILIMPMTSDRSSFSPQLMGDWNSYYPQDLNGINFLSSNGVGLDFLLSPLPQRDKASLLSRGGIRFLIIFMTSKGLNFSPLSVRDWVSFYPHDLSGIELLSLVDEGLDFLLSPRPQRNRAPLLGPWGIRFLIFPMTLVGSSFSPRLIWD